MSLALGLFFFFWSLFSMKINVFHLFLTSRFKIHLSSAITSITGAPRWTGGGVRTVWGQPMLFECMKLSVMSSAHECEMRGSVASRDIHLFDFVQYQLQHIILGGLVVHF